MTAISLDRLRAELMAQVPRPRRVTAAFTQYFMDEDTAAFCDIDVQPGAVCEFGIEILRTSLVPTLAIDVAQLFA